MEAFLHEIKQGETLELLIDTNIFHKDIILRSAYAFLDRAYFFFKFDENKNIILQLTKKWNTASLWEILADFSDEMLAVYLRDRLERDNKTIRETIVQKAINGPLDLENFVTLDTSSVDNSQSNQVNFDQDIDEILKEIENDQDFQVNENEIQDILKEIEDEVQWDMWKPTVTFDPKKLGDIKKSFSKNK